MFQSLSSLPIGLPSPGRLVSSMSLNHGQGPPPQGSPRALPSSLDDTQMSLPSRREGHWAIGRRLAGGSVPLRYMTLGESCPPLGLRFLPWEWDTPSPLPLATMSQ